jgi:hypothetical protein
VSKVLIVPKAGKSTGTITHIYYTGLPPTVYAKTENIDELIVGSYIVTFDIAAAPNWNAATGLNAGTLVIQAANIAEELLIVAHEAKAGKDAIEFLQPTYITSAGTVTISAAALVTAEYTVVMWYVNGSPVDEKGNTYTLPPGGKGKYNVGVLVKKGDIYYDAEVEIIVN